LEDLKGKEYLGDIEVNGYLKRLQTIGNEDVD
jgi:hypothetical protein